MQDRPPEQFIQNKDTRPGTKPHKRCGSLQKKYSRIIEAFRYYDIISENSHEKVTVKFNDGGILYIEVEEKKVLK